MDSSLFTVNSLRPNQTKAKSGSRSLELFTFPLIAHKKFPGNPSRSGVQSRMMSNFGSIKELNNAAASLLTQGKTIDAGRICQQALMNLKTIVGEVAGSTMQGIPTSVRIRSVGGEVEHPTLRKAEQAFSPNNAFEVYNCAYFIEGGGSNMDTLAAVLFYNLALALHCRGIIESQEALLEKSLRFYQASATILSDAHMLRPENSSIYAVYMANLANQSHICSHWMDPVGVRTCIDGMTGLVQHESADLGGCICFYQMIFQMSEGGVLRNAPSA